MKMTVSMVLKCRRHERAMERIHTEVEMCLGRVGDVTTSNFECPIVDCHMVGTETYTVEEVIEDASQEEGD